jgi:hypothetical protein
MSPPTNGPDGLLKYELEVGDHGRLEMKLPIESGARVVVYVCRETADDCTDLIAAAESSLDFWDNPLDDMDWNDA